MTAIVGVLNSQGIAIAADSAVTVTTGTVKKVYNRSNKLFTLSKYHPVGIAIYNNAQFMGIPWETLIKMYRKQLKERSFDTVEKYKLDFLSFLSKNVDLITPEFKNDDFFAFCSTAYGEIRARLSKLIEDHRAAMSAMDEPARAAYLVPLISQLLEDYKTYVDSIDKSKLVTFTFDNFKRDCGPQLNEVVQVIQNEIAGSAPQHSLTVADKEVIKEIFYIVIKIDHIFEQFSGLVFMGFGEKEVYPSSHQVIVGSAVNNVIRYKIHPPIVIAPGKLNADIVPYAQSDVTTTVLTGIDPAYNNEIVTSITKAFDTISAEVAARIPVPADSAAMSQIIKDTSKTLVQNLNDYRDNTITAPLISILNHMGKEDMAEMAESLVSITSLKRKFTANSADESVGGPVDVAVITKGDGFIWIKRKHYFDAELNSGFINRYHK